MRAHSAAQGAGRAVSWNPALRIRLSVKESNLRRNRALDTWCLEGVVYLIISSPVYLHELFQLIAPVGLWMRLVSWVQDLCICWASICVQPFLHWVTGWHQNPSLCLWNVSICHYLNEFKSLIPFFLLKQGLSRFWERSELSADFLFPGCLGLEARCWWKLSLLIVDVFLPCSPGSPAADFCFRGKHADIWSTFSLSSLSLPHKNTRLLKLKDVSNGL